MRQNIVILTGAGISAESGLDTFRDENGLWKQYDAKKLATASAFYENPQPVLDFYNSRRKQLLEVEPNHAANLIHYAHPEIPKFILNPNQIEVPDNFTYIQNTATKGIDSLIEKLIFL